MVTLAQGVADLLARMTVAGWRPATVEAIDTAAGTLTLTMSDGEPVAGVSWQANAYSPAVGDRVTVMWDRHAGMLVTGTLSTQSVVVGEQESMTVAPTGRAGVARFPDGLWHWLFSRQLLLTQGAYWTTSQAFGGPGVREDASVIGYPDLTGILPAGASDVAATLRIRRAPLTSSTDGTVVSPWGVSPALWAHSYDPLPDPDVATGPPVVDEALGEWRPGRLVAGEAANFPLPQAWLDGLLAGEVTGIVSMSDSDEDRATFFGLGNLDLTIAYTPAGEA